jgi:hypothetical protein
MIRRWRRAGAAGGCSAASTCSFGRAHAECSNLCDDCRSNTFSRYLIYVVVTLVLVGIPGGLGFLGLGQPGAICGGLLGGIVAIFVAWRIMPD